MRIDLRELSRDVERRNAQIRRTNCYLRYNSPEETEYVYGSCIGLLSSWSLFRKIDTPIGRNNLYFTRKYARVTPGLPKDWSKLIGTFLTRQDANVVTQTCHAAHQTAKATTEAYIAKHGKSYNEQPYEPNPYIGILLGCF